jgi:hypothetical protein
MPQFLCSLPFFAPLSIRNYYAKNIHPQAGSDPVYRMLEFATEQTPFVPLKGTQCVYTDRTYAYLDQLKSILTIFTQYLRGRHKLT